MEVDDQGGRVSILSITLPTDRRERKQTDKVQDDVEVEQ